MECQAFQVSVLPLCIKPGTSLISACPSLLTLGTNSSLGAFSPNELQILLLGTGRQSGGPRHGFRFCLLPLALVFRMALGRWSEPHSGQKQSISPPSPARSASRQLPPVPPTAMEEALRKTRYPPTPTAVLFARRSGPLSLAN